MVDFDKLVLYVEAVGDERDRQRMGQLLNGETDGEEWPAGDKTIPPFNPTMDILRTLNTPELARILTDWLNAMPDIHSDERRLMLESGADILESRQDEKGGWLDVDTTLLSLRILMQLERLDSHPFFN